MAIYWRLQSIPELKGLSKKRGEELVRQVNRRLWPTKIAWAIVYVLILSVDPVVGLIVHFRRPPLPDLSWILLGVSFCWIALLPPLVNGKARPYIAQILAGCCANCGYDLRATPERCPECGAVPSQKGARVAG
jgi:hypothetical protein